MWMLCVYLLDWIEAVAAAASTSTSSSSLSQLNQLFIYIGER